MSEYELDLNIVREIDLEVDTTVYKGADGVTFYPTVSSAGVISWTNDGDKENPEPVNIKGPQGDQGPAGQDGQNGTTFTPTVSTAGVISWTNDGGKQNPPSVNIKGPQGETGPAGQGVPTGGSTGQVLKKKSGTNYDTEWAIESGGGGSSGLKVTVTKTGSTYSADKTFSEISTAIASGVNVFVVYSNDVYTLISITASQAVFNLPFFENQNQYYFYSSALTIRSNNTVGYSTSSFPSASTQVIQNELYALGILGTTEFDFTYDGDAGLQFSYYQSLGLQNFFEAGDPHQGILTVEVTDGNGNISYDYYRATKVWGYYGDEFTGKAIFSRARISSSPNKILIDELELTWDSGTDECTLTGNTAEVSATSLTPLYPAP